MQHARALLVTSLAAMGCWGYPHYPAATRDYDRQGATLLRIRTGCHEMARLRPGPGPQAPDVQPPWVGKFSAPWEGDSWGTAFVINERYAVTAAHLVRCPNIPTVDAWLPDGRYFRLVVTDDLQMFGPGKDVARLAIQAQFEHFDLRAGPPVRGKFDPHGHQVGCTVTWHGHHCGYTDWAPPDSKDDFVTLGDGTVKGDSGAPVYDTDGTILGVMTGPYVDVGGFVHMDGVVEVPQPWL